jgi:hypothetical protein
MTMTERDSGRQKISKDGLVRRLADRLIGVPALMPRVLEAIDSLQEEDATEPSEAQIYQRANKLHPPEHSWQTIQDGTFFRTLDVLEAAGKIVHRRVGATEAVETNTNSRRVYHRVVPQTPPQSGQ